MSFGDTTLTVIGNLTADPELRFSQLPREFVISEARVRLNRRVDALVERIPTAGFRNRRVVASSARAACQ
ncbi:hypothetical protein DFJ69_6098 [Thermomonospora umbrina]|uniref:Single-stranded DNA-binding protein n=1 Tax=Thermomonospora umbrina TaxID=111806 RepID=A0A3D9SXH2_9ACTN|nr:hypothetical protein DFJ69_6098 [Thermomonospora umbrina]